MSAHPMAVLGVNIPYNGGSKASSSASDTPDSATNFAVCLCVVHIDNISYFKKQFSIAKFQIQLALVKPKVT